MALFVQMAKHSDLMDRYYLFKKDLQKCFKKLLLNMFQPLAHPSFAHPTSCQKFITCYFSKDIRELGCQKGQVFDHRALKCTSPEDGPADW
jgi:hypothetical protein